MNYLTFEQWDVIADTYIPILALLCVFQLIYSLLKRSHNFREDTQLHIKHTIIQFGVILCGIIWVYALMFIDGYFQIWPSITLDNHTLDYSTHTALALVFCSFIFFRTVSSQRYLAWLVLTSMVLYLWLMKYQNYHTAADMLTTILVALPPIFWIMKKTALHMPS